MKIKTTNILDKMNTTSKKKVSPQLTEYIDLAMSYLNLAVDVLSDIPEGKPNDKNVKDKKEYDRKADEFAIQFTRIYLQYVDEALEIAERVENIDILSFEEFTELTVAFYIIESGEDDDESVPTEDEMDNSSLKEIQTLLEEFLELIK